MTDYIEHLKQQLHEIDRGIERAKARFEDSAADRKEKALAELSELRLRHDTLARRIAEAKEKGSEEWSELHTSFREEADALKDTLESWLTKLG